MSARPMTLVDWTPAIEVALVGGLLALLPVLWVGFRLRRRPVSTPAESWLVWRRALTLVTLLLTIDLVVFGAFTRLTDSGLGCPDWPGCYGNASPVGAHSDISQALEASPNGPVTHGKAWIEMIHRYLATMVGALITLLMVLAWWGRHKVSARSPVSPWWAVATFVWVCVQGAFGALTVTMKLYPLVVSIHLLGGLLGVCLLAAQVGKFKLAGHHGEVASGGASPRTMLLALWCVWMMQAALGAWVSTNGAVLVCADVPTCQGQWWPEMDWQQGFSLLRHLGQSASGDNITVPALTAIHVTHRLGALVVCLATLFVAFRLWRGKLSRQAALLVLLLLWQLVSGLSNVVLGWPLLAALAHTLGAALMAAYLVFLAVVS